MRSSARAKIFCAAGVIGFAAAISACGSLPVAVSAPVAETAPASAPPPRDPREEIPVTVDPGATIAATGATMAAAAERAHLSCASAVFVWGDLVSVGDARPMTLTLDGGEPIRGWALCSEGLAGFLAVQRENPRLKGSHGGAADVRWSEGQLLLRRAWGNASEAPLGDLSGDGGGVLQKGELLAAIFDPKGLKEDATSRADHFLPVLARVPRLFLFGMWPLPSARGGM